MPEVFTSALPHLDEWAATVDVTQPDKATDAFFPTIARYGLAFNLILPKKVRDHEVGTWRLLFGAAWTPALDAAAKAGLLYVIDFRIYETLQPQKVAGVPRFTPSTVTVLVQDPATKALTPELVRVAGGNNEPKVFSRRGSTTASAWVYALQAAKASVTVFGVWLGHVYQWHIVTAAMVMTMFDNLSANHPVRKLLEPQSSYVIPFDNVLLLAFSAVVPPTSIATARQFVELMDLYASTREFFDDDPTTTLERLGITESDFTVQEAWDQYPNVGRLLEIWNATGRYVSTYVDRTYGTDQDVQLDGELQTWIGDSTKEDSRQRPWSAGHGFERCAEAGSPQPRLPHHRAWQQPSVPRCESGSHVRRQLPTLPAGRNHPRSDRQLRYQGVAAVPSQNRHHWIDALLLLHVLGFDALRPLRPDRRSRSRPVLR